jgi:hypothetical protein|tara:strand:+ start:1828 stop:2109 length:282 start_codon:yes stop_codon:yes gene_type:complete
MGDNIMGRQQSEGRTTDKVARNHSAFEVGDLVKVVRYTAHGTPDSLGLVVEVKGKIHGANHDWNKYYYMVQIVGTKYPTPIWNENLELVRKVK